MLWLHLVTAATVIVSHARFKSLNIFMLSLRPLLKAPHNKQPDIYKMSIRRSPGASSEQMQKRKTAAPRGANRTSSTGVFGPGPACHPHDL